MLEEKVANSVLDQQSEIDRLAFVGANEGFPL